MLLAKNIEEWRQAEGRAREAERTLADLLDALQHGRGCGPSESHVTEAKLLRKLATSRLTTAIASMGAQGKRAT